MRAREALVAAAARLGEPREGLPDPHHEARFLLALAWGLRPAQLAARLLDSLPGEVDKRFRALVERRAAFEPAHYLAGEVPFYGRDFQVSPAVLIPRPETEMLVESLLALPMPARARVLDVGTGSGCIALSLAAERPQWSVLATDISIAALEVVRANRTRLGVDCDLVASDLGSSLAGPFDLVAANLPYLPPSMREDLAPELEWEPALALYVGDSGLELVETLVAQLRRLLKPGGYAGLELGHDQAAIVAELATRCGLEVVKCVRDYAQFDRHLILRSSW